MRSFTPCNTLHASTCLIFRSWCDCRFPLSGQPPICLSICMLLLSALMPPLMPHPRARAPFIPPPSGTWSLQVSGYKNLSLSSPFIGGATLEGVQAPGEVSVIVFSSPFRFPANDQGAQILGQAQARAGRIQRVTGDQAVRRGGHAMQRGGWHTASTHRGIQRVGGRDCVWRGKGKVPGIATKRRVDCQFGMRGFGRRGR